MKLTQQQKEFIRQNEHADVRKLALRLDKEKYRELDVEFMLKQIAGRQKAKEKIPGWYNHYDIIYPVHLSLEQASSEAAANYKVSLIPDGSKTFVDLTGGMGVDFTFLSQRFAKSVYVEQNPELCEIAEHNFNVLDLQNVAIESSASETFLEKMPEVDVIYLDPSRRDDTGRKVVRIEDCSPDLLGIQDLLLAKAKIVLVKFSPMLDISMVIKALKDIVEVHVVSVENECKELLFLCSRLHINSERYVAVNLTRKGGVERFHFTPEEEQNATVSFTRFIGKYLYEPNTSILKAGGFKSIVKQFDVEKLHVNSHLYTADNLISNFPGRVFEVKDWFTPNKKNIKTFVSKTRKVNISVRNFPMSVAEIRKKNKLQEGGDLYLFATTMADENLIWVIGTKPDF